MNLFVAYPSYSSGSPDLVSLLLRFGADPCLKNGHGLTPLALYLDPGTVLDPDIAPFDREAVRLALMGAQQKQPPTATPTAKVGRTGRLSG